MLHARLAEIRALHELPTATKNKIFPIIRARPWLNSKSLDAVWDKIGEAFPERLFGLDLDTSRNVVGKDTEAYRSFRELFVQDDGFSAYYDLVRKQKWAVPVLRSAGFGFPELERQLDHALEIDRGLIVRVEPMRSTNLISVAESIQARFQENVVFAFDCGWGRDILSQAATCVSLIEQLLNVRDDVEIVIGGSSFPDKFDKQGQRIEIRMEERLLFQEVRRNLNRGVLFYGDWGSTRPPTDPIPMKNVPRIDFALPGQWIAHRSGSGENYDQLADNVLTDEAWTDGLGIWGEYMIQSTAAGLEPSIKSPAMAAAVRVNLHLHIQANFDDPIDMFVADEPFED
jgi:Beta protein